MSQVSTIHLQLRYHLKRRPVKQSYFLQDVETVFQQLINDSLNCQALPPLHYLCHRYNMPKSIQKQARLQLVATNTPSPFSLSINILTSVVFAAQIAATDLMRDFSQTQSNQASFFKGMIERLSSFLSTSGQKETIVMLEVVFSLADAIRTVNYGLMSQSEVQEMEVIENKQVVLDYGKDRCKHTFQQLLFFGKSLKNVNWYDMRAYSQWLLKEIFDNQCQCVLVDLFSLMLDAFECYPAIISKALKQLSKQADHLRNLLRNQSGQVFLFLQRLLPAFKLEVVEAILQVIAVLLEANQEYCHLVWQSEALMECLQGALQMPKEAIQLQALHIYRMLLLYEDYQQVAWRIEERRLPSILLRAFTCKHGRNLISSQRVILEGLKLIQQVMQFQRKLLKFSRIKRAVFTINLRDSGLGCTLEEIYCRFDGYIKALTIAILGQNFVKIQGEIQPITSIHRSNKTALQICE